MKNLPIPLLTFLAAQVGAAVWWGAQIDAKVSPLPLKVTGLQFT